MVLNAVVTKEKQINLEKNSPGSEISECLEHEVKSKIGNIFVNQKILEEYSGKIYEIDSYFYEHYRKKIQVDENGRKYILLRIDIYFTKYPLAIEIDEKYHTDIDLIFEEENQKEIEKIWLQLCQK